MSPTLASWDGRPSPRARSGRGRPPHFGLRIRRHVPWDRRLSPRARPGERLGGPLLDLQQRETIPSQNKHDRQKAHRTTTNDDVGGLGGSGEVARPGSHRHKGLDNFRARQPHPNPNKAHQHFHSPGGSVALRPKALAYPSPASPARRRGNDGPVELDAAPMRAGAGVLPSARAGEDSPVLIVAAPRV